MTASSKLSLMWIVYTLGLGFILSPFVMLPVVVGSLLAGVVIIVYYTENPKNTKRLLDEDILLLKQKPKRQHGYTSERFAELLCKVLNEDNVDLDNDEYFMLVHATSVMLDVLREIQREIGIPNHSELEFIEGE